MGFGGVPETRMYVCNAAVKLIRVRRNLTAVDTASLAIKTSSDRDQTGSVLLIFSFTVLLRIAFDDIPRFE